MVSYSSKKINFQGSLKLTALDHLSIQQTCFLITQNHLINHPP